MENQNQDLVTAVRAKSSLNSVAVIASVVFLALVSGNASAADVGFTLDTTSILQAIGTTIAAVTAVGLSAMSIFLVVKALKYIKTAF